MTAPLKSSTETNTKTEFQAWLDLHDRGRTTLEHQIRLARKLYNDACVVEAGPFVPSDQQIIENLEQTPIQGTDSLVTWKGFQVGWFLNDFCQTPYMQKLKNFGCPLWFIRKVCVIEMIRRTKTDNCHGTNKVLSGPFVDHLEDVASGWGMDSNSNISTVISCANRFVSYTGAYTLEYLMQALEQLPQEDYIWMDIFCVDQFAWTGKGRSNEMQHFRSSFMQDLQCSIGRIGKTALVLEKWNNVMGTLEQIWVLWEIFNTANVEAELEVLFSKQEVSSYISNCLESDKEFGKILESLSSIDANKARAQEESDRSLIFERMEKAGLHNVNTMVISKMRDWLLNVAKAHLSHLRQNGDTVNAPFLNRLGLLMRSQGKYLEAESIFREALQTSQLVLGEEHPETLTTMNNLGLLLEDEGKFAESESLHTKALLLRRQQGNLNQDTLTSISSLGWLLKRQEKFEGSEPLLREALSGRLQLLGPNHPETLSSFNGLGAVLSSLGKLEEAEYVLIQAVIGRTSVLGERHPDTLTSVHNLGLLCAKKGAFGAAEKFLRQASSGFLLQLGKHHPTTLSSIAELGLLLKDMGKLEEAESLLKQVFDTRQELFGKKHPEALKSAATLGSLLQDQGRFDEAEVLMRLVAEEEQRKHGNLHPETLVPMNNLATLLHDQGKLDEAEHMYRDVLEVFRGHFGSQHSDTLKAINNLASLLQEQGKLDEAEPLLRETLETKQEQLGEEHKSTLLSLNNLAGLLYQQKKTKEAEVLFQQVLDGFRYQLGPHHPQTLISMNNLAVFYHRGGQHEAAIQLLQDEQEGWKALDNQKEAAEAQRLLEEISEKLKEQADPH